MTVISLRSDKPTKKDSSCINICTCEHYLKSVLAEMPCGRLFSGIIGNRKFFVTDENTGRLISVTHDYLLEPGSWISNDLLNSVYQNTISILDDPDAIYKAGKISLKPLWEPRFF